MTDLLDSGIPQLYQAKTLGLLNFAANKAVELPLSGQYRPLNVSSMLVQGLNLDCTTGLKWAECLHIPEFNRAWLEGS